MSKTQKQWYLVTETEWFFDGHGVPNRGDINKFLTQDDMYLRAKKRMYYFSDDIPDKDEDPEDIKYLESNGKDLQAEDGYNCVRSTYKVKKIKSEKELARIKQVLSDYKKL